MSKSSPKQLEPKVFPKLKAWQTSGLILGLAIVIIAALAWKCTRDPGINFFPGHGQAEWIMFPRVMDSSAHHVADIDTTFRRQITLGDNPRTARLDLRAAKRAEVTINDAAVAFTGPVNWKDAASVEVTSFLHAGENTISVKVINDNAPAALWLTLTADQVTLLSDKNWEASCADSAWRPVVTDTPPPVPGPGNTMSGGDKTISALGHIWIVWVIFIIIAALICFAVYKWFPQIMNGDSENGLTTRQVTVLLAVIAGFWLVLFCNNAALMPFLHGFDSQEHSEYIKYIQEHHSLPLPTDGFEMFQPPLYYLISAGALSIFGLSVTVHEGVIVLRFLTFVFGVIQFTLVFLSMRLLFRDRIVVQLIGLLLAAFLPMQIYLSHYVTNETLAATMVTASVYLAVRLLQTRSPATSQFAWLGVALGAAMLSKATALLVVLPVFVAVAISLATQRKSASTWLKQFGTLAAVFVVVCGWQYFRIWTHFGNPLLGNWDPATGFSWWQDPGYHTASDYLRFGRSLVTPFFSGFATFWDGIYSTLWGDGLCGGVPSISFRPPWNYNLMTAGYLLSLVPSVMILVGAVVALWRFVQKPSTDWFVLFGLTGAVLFGVIYMTLKVASYAQVKAFYGLAALVPICAFAAVGWDVLTHGKNLWKGLFGFLLLIWAMNSFASFWIVRCSDLHVYVGLRLGAEGNIEAARAEATRAVEIDSSNATAQRFLSFMLSDAGRAAEALQHAQRAVELSPADGSCHSQLGMALAGQNQMEAAIRENRRALELIPEDLSVYSLLRNCLTRAGREAEAFAVGRDALAVYPYNAELQHAIGVAYAQKREFVVAARHFVYTRLLWPGYAQGRTNFRLALVDLARGTDGTSHIREITAMGFSSPEILNDIAWFYATDPDAGLRNASEAVRLAERGCVLANRDPRMVVTLAAAYAESARLPDAIKAAEEAHSGARITGDQETMKLTEKLLAQFRAGQPYREAPTQK